MSDAAQSLCGRHGEECGGEGVGLGHDVWRDGRIER